MKTLVLISSLFISLNLFSATKEEVTMKDKITVNGSELILNGMGIRRATIFNVHVYVGGLYLPQKTKDATELLNQPYPKRLVMNFVRSVDKEKLQDAWNEGFEAAIKEEDQKGLRARFDQFNSYMKDVEDKDIFSMDFLKKGVILSVKEKVHPLIKGEDFSKALLSIWFLNARDEDLRDELLGKEI